MKRKFTKLAAAFALLAALCFPLGMRGQGTTIYSQSGGGSVTGWTFQNNVTTNAIDKSSYWLLDAGNPGDYIQTSAYDLSSYSTASISLNAATYGSGNSPIAVVEVSFDGGTTFNSITLSGTQPTSSSYNTLTGTISSGLTNTVVIKYSNGITNGRGLRLQQLELIAYTGGSQPETYSVTYDAGNGTGTMTDPNSPYEEDDVVTLLESTFTPPTGYEWNSWQVKDASDNTITVSNGTFTMPASNVTVTAQYAQSNNQTLTFDFEDEGAHRPASETNVFTGTNEYTENDVDIVLTYADATTTGSPLTGSAHVVGRVAKNTTNSPVVLIGPIDISNWTISKIEYNTKGVAAMSQEFETSLNGTSWTSQLSITSMPTSKTKETINNLSITGTDLYLRWTVSVASSTGSNRDFNLDDIVITYTEASNPVPSFTINNNNELAYNATSGSFTFTVNNPVDGGETTIDENVEWISGASITGNTVNYTTTSNEATTPRQGIITLTYTYGDNETVTKDVTVTQAAAPVIYSTIPALFAAATSTITEVLVTFGGWVVSGTSHNGYNVFVTDGTNGFIINGGDHGFEAGNTLTSTTPIVCSLQLKNGYAQITGITASTEGLTIGTGTITVANIEMANLAGVNTGALVSYNNLTCSVSTSGNYTNYDLSDGTTTIRAYGSIFSDYDDYLEDGKTYNITGVYQQYNSNTSQTKEILPRNADDIEEVELPVINANNVTIAYDATSGAIAYSIDHAVTGTNLTATTTADWISNIAVGNESVTFTTTVNEGNADRTATFTLSYAGAQNKTVTVTQGHFETPASLPFNWAGGISADLDALSGVSVNCDATDYAATNAPYRVKFNADGHYILINTNEQPAVVSVGIKKYATGNTASLTIEGSSDGETFTEVQSFSITGAQNAVFTYITTNAFASTDRYVRIYYNKPDGGSNVGVGPIIIRGIESYPLTISGYASDETKDGYYLIASPVTVNPANVEGMTTGDFDLYYFDQAEEDEWRNYEVSAFNLVPGKGYLYAKKGEGQTYNFTLTGTPYVGTGEFSLYNNGAEFAGWNLVGNPFDVEAEISMDYYEMNETGSGLIAGTDYVIDAMQGVFVQYSEGDETVIFMPAETGTNSGEGSKLVVNLGRQGTAVDRAIVRFGEGRQLPKFQLFENNTKIYVTEGNKDYAVVRSAAEAEMPVSFRASENGTYTLAVEAENVEMNYLHLIDNMTGADVDLLATPSYSFEARTTDYANRFRLVFSANGTNDNEAETFAYFNGSSWTISNVGDATLQVVDVTGRTVANQMINGNAELNLNQPAGVYVIRLVNGDNVKTQKVVVR